MRARNPLVLLLLVAVLVPAAGVRLFTQVAAGGSLDEARGFYAAAEYERALALLDHLVTDPALEDGRPAAEFYRALCLLALGRSEQATVAVETLVAEHPAYRPETELPPRVQALFEDARARLLPTAVQARYLAARAAYDQRDYRSALQGFTETLQLFSLADVGQLADDPPLADLWVLADGFLELSAAALSPPTATVVAEPIGVPVGPAEPTPPPAGPVLYSAADPDVVPPRVIDQSIPAFPGPIRTTREGVIQVVIDDRGTVAQSTVLESLGEQYDELALAAARQWQYQPAMLAGTPVRFVKRVRVSLVPSP